MSSPETDDRERTLKDVLENPADDLESTVFLWVDPENMEQSIIAMRRSSLVWIVAREENRLLVEAREGEDVESVVDFEGRENVELAYGSRFSSRDSGIFDRMDIAERDLEREI